MSVLFKKQNKNKKQGDCWQVALDKHDEDDE